MARAGLYRERITLLLAGTVESDGMGGWLPAGAGTEYPVWARVTQLRGTQVVALGREIDTQLFRVTTRYQPSYLGAERLAWGTRTLKVLTHTVDERSTEITFTVVDGQ